MGFFLKRHYFGSIELLLIFVQWQLPLFQTGTEKQILHCRIDLSIYFVKNIFLPEKNIQLKQPLFYCGFKLPCERIVFDFHDDTRLFHIVYLGIY
jgi:hypothetical protein